jgi:hypothetical protein
MKNVQQETNRIASSISPEVLFNSSMIIPVLYIRFDYHSDIYSFCMEIKTLLYAKEFS